MLAALVSRSLLTPDEAELAREVPLAGDVTVEADSGGHTDSRPLTALLPTILALRDRIASERQYERAIRVGAAGGLGTPSAVAGAFAMGAAYVLTGSINQSATESGLSWSGRCMLAEADISDVAMAPAADMFEIGAKVQVLKRGTMFAQRGQKLYSLYRSYDSLESLPAEERENLERHYFRTGIEDVWNATRVFFETSDPREIERAEREPRHRMALLFRWYLFHASRWAADGTDDRRGDFQIWCGPAMGAFNAWVRGSFLQPLENRTVAQIARNLLEGAAVSARAQQLRACGVPVPAAAFAFRAAATPIVTRAPIADRWSRRAFPGLRRAGRFLARHRPRRGSNHGRAADPLADRRTTMIPIRRRPTRLIPSAAPSWADGVRSARVRHPADRSRPRTRHSCSR